MDKPSDPILRWLRDRIAARGENTASIAVYLDKPRAEMRRILAGEQPITLDDFIAITDHLKASPADLAFESDAVPDEDEDADRPEATQWQNQPETLAKLAFDLGIDVVFLCTTEVLRGVWNGPDAWLDRYADEPLPIGLDAAYHKHMNPVFKPEGLEVSIGFDKLYRCLLPWQAFERVIFRPFLPEPKPQPPSRPVLRIVK